MVYQRPWSFHFCSSSHPRGTFGSTNLDVLNYIPLVGGDNFFESQSRQFRLFSNMRSYLRVGFLSLCHQQSLFCRISMDFQGLRSGFCFSCSSRFMLYRCHEHCFVRGQLLLVILSPEPRRILCIWLAVLMHCQQLFTYWL